MVHKSIIRRIALGAAAAAIPATLLVSSVIHHGGVTGYSKAAFTAAAVDSSGGPSGTCPGLQIFGVRGSRTNSRDLSSTDPTIQAAEQRIQGLVPRTAIHNVLYPAVPVGFGLQYYGLTYVASVATGEFVLSREISNINSSCRFTPIVLIGYSQGAQVAEREYLALPAALQRKTILLTFGNPLFDGADSRTDQGTYSSRLNGIFGQIVRSELVSFSAQEAPNVHNYCLANDPICNFTAANLARCILPSCVHYNYPTSPFMAASAAWVDQRWLSIRNTI